MSAFYLLFPSKSPAENGEIICSKIKCRKTNLTQKKQAYVSRYGTRRGERESDLKI